MTMVVGTRGQTADLLRAESTKFNAPKKQLSPSIRASTSTSNTTSSSPRGSTKTSPPKNKVQFSSEHVEEKKANDERSISTPQTAKLNKRRGYKPNKRYPLDQVATPNSEQVEERTPLEPDNGNEKGKPKGFSLAGIGRRISCRFGDKRKQKGFVKVAEDEEEDDEPPPPELDPVVQIFESRNTQRVRWALEGVESDPNTVAESSPAETASTKPPDAISPDNSKQSGAHIKQFMSKALFGSSKPSKRLDEEMQAEVASLGGSLVWESAETPTGPEVIHTSKQSNSTTSELLLSFTEDPKARTTVAKLLEKARKAEHLHFRYEYAVKCYLKALKILQRARYPDDHPTVAKTVALMNNAHHVLSSYNNSANIVKMGIKYEDAGELVRALKMYTIAYRIRRDNLSRNHPSLVVLLNMLGSIQIKRGELQEAMQIYELALKDSPVIFVANKEDDEVRDPPADSLLAKSVTYREMGVIYERWGRINDALKIYHKSLECVAEWKEAMRRDTHSTATRKRTGSANLAVSMKDVKLAPVVSDRHGADDGEMEVFIGNGTSGFGVSKTGGNPYESFFPACLEQELARTKGTVPAGSNSESKTRQDAHADMDLALTLHQIAQLRRCQGEYAKALDAYEVALRGMKYALGKHHPNVAAVLGNIGNLQKEMGDMDAAYTTYQEVLGIESYRLGLSHPDVAITLHNIATIDAARGNYEHSLQLYHKVIGLQKKLFGEEHLSVAVTAACMGDVYEKLGNYPSAMESYEQSVRIKSVTLGRHSLDVARLLHKLGKLAFISGDYLMADSFLSRAVLVYRLNKVDDEHEWLVDANRDSADIDAALAMGKGRHFEC